MSETCIAVVPCLADFLDGERNDMLDRKLGTRPTHPERGNDPVGCRARGARRKRVHQTVILLKKTERPSQTGLVVTL